MPKEQNSATPILWEDDSLYFLPLGGTDEIGMNMYLYRYMGKWLMIDCGITFAGIPGISFVTPDIRFIKEIVDDICGIVITHGHEDHIGALPTLWDEIKAPIYATKFTAGLIKGKREDLPIKIVNVMEKIDIGPFSIEFMPITHSIPESNFIVIRTKHGNIVHSGDWRFDSAPVLGPAPDFEALKQLGNEGVEAFICDSTNVFETRESKTEQEVQDSLIKVVESCHGRRIIATCFASNLPRLASFVKAAEANHRYPVIVGRSLFNMDSVARSCGYFDDIPAFLTPEQAVNVDPENLLIVCTGSQGEERSALASMANGKHQHFKIERGDVVIFSSRIIPGNEDSIGKVQNIIARRGAEIIVNGSRLTHVSGHPIQSDLKQMYGMLKPKKAIPMHGEERHLIFHANMAEKEWGVENSIVPCNGSAIKIGPGPMEVVGKVHHGKMYLDGKKLIPSNGVVMHQRFNMMESGILIVSISVDKDFGITGMKISNAGIGYESYKSLYRVIKNTVEGLGDDISEQHMQSSITKALVSILRRPGKRAPIIHVQVVMQKEERDYSSVEH